MKDSRPNCSLGLVQTLVSFELGRGLHFLSESGSSWVYIPQMRQMLLSFDIESGHG